MRKNSLRGFETTAVSTLVHRMVIAGATAEEIAKVTDYFVAAVDFDCARIHLEETAMKTDIKSICEKYNTFQSFNDLLMKYCENDVKSTMNLFNELSKSRTSINLSEIKVGDQITINLKGFGEFIATAHKVTEKDVLFIFDDYITERPMNENGCNAGGYEKSDLKKWIDSELFEAFPDELKSKISKLSIPSVGELVGWDDEWDKEHFEPDGNGQLPLMKKRRNRVAYLNNECSWGWLRNATKKEYSAADFAFVYYLGGAGYCGASTSGGVRPVFLLVR